MLPFISISDSHSANIVERWHLYNTSMDKNNMRNNKMEKLLLRPDSKTITLKSNWDFVVLSLFLSLPLIAKSSEKIFEK